MARYRKPSARLFKKNREKLFRLLPAHSVAIVFAAVPYPANADAALPFEQDSNFYYLTGIDEPHCILVLWKQSAKNTASYLFIPYTDEHKRIWEGETLTPETAQQQSGISQIFYLHEFESFLLKHALYIERFYLDFNEHPRNTYFSWTPALQFYHRFLKERFPAHEVRRLAPLLYKIRAIKEPEEIEQLRKACQITAETFKELLQIVRPGIWEYEIEAEVWRHFLKRGATKPAYPPIVASGKNACILHYMQNDHQCPDGALLLLDIGAEYGHYSADLTRTIPINGTFTPRQKQLYQIVLRTLNYATSLLKPGNDLNTYHHQVRTFLQEELLKIGLLKKEEVKEDKSFKALSKYFMHGVSHLLGLDTHDVYGPEVEQTITFQPGMVFTCEPGLYIREEGIGIRLENDILITEKGNENLLKDAPILIEEIEELMRSGK